MKCGQHCVGSSERGCVHAAGDASFTVNGKSIAFAQATAISEAIATGYATASSCDKCVVAAGVVVKSISELLLTASAKSEVTLEGATTGAETVSVSVQNFVNAVVERTVTAAAQVWGLPGAYTHLPFPHGFTLRVMAVPVRTRAIAQGHNSLQQLVAATRPLA